MAHFLVVLPLIYALAVFLGLRIVRSRVNRRMREIAAALRAQGIQVVGEKPASSAWSAGEVELEDGARVTVRHWGRWMHLISLAVPGPASPPVWIRRERGFDRLAKGLGLEREVELGVADFDRELYVASRAPDAEVRAALAGGETQQLIRESVSSGYGIHLWNGGVSASTLQYYLQAFDAGIVPARLTRLRALAASLPQAAATPMAPFNPMSTFALLVGAFTAMFVPLILLTAMRDLVHPPVENLHVLEAIGFGLVAWLAVVALVAKRLQRRPLALFEVPAVAVALLASVPFIAACGLFFVNAQLDHSPAVTHQVQIVDFYKHNRGTVWVAPWDNPARRQKVILPSSLLPVKIGDALSVEAHAGAFGWEWVSEVAQGNK
jgi:hypothetical protein